MPTTLDRLKALLIRKELAIWNLPDGDRDTMLVSAALAIPAETELTEKDVTGRLFQWLSGVGNNVTEDAVELRRYLVDFRLLHRDIAGRVYVRPKELPSKFKEVDAELGAVDLAAFAEQVRADETARRAARKQQALSKQSGMHG